MRKKYQSYRILPARPVSAMGPWISQMRSKYALIIVHRFAYAWCSLRRGNRSCLKLESPESMHLLRASLSRDVGKSRLSAPGRHDIQPLGAFSAWLNSWLLDSWQLGNPPMVGVYRPTRFHFHSFLILHLLFVMHQFEAVSFFSFAIFDWEKSFVFNYKIWCAYGQQNCPDVATVTA